MLDHHHISWVGPNMLASEPTLVCVARFSLRISHVNCERRLRDLAAWEHSGEDLHPLALPPASLFSCVCWRGLTRRCAHHGYTAVSVTHTECVFADTFLTARPLCSQRCIKAHYIFFLTRRLSRGSRPSVPGRLTLQAEMLRPFATKENSGVIYSSPLFALWRLIDATTHL